MCKLFRCSGHDSEHSWYPETIPHSKQVSFHLDNCSFRYVRFSVARSVNFTVADQSLKDSKDFIFSSSNLLKFRRPGSIATDMSVSFL
ncbi:hypothetical protein AYI69_g9520 [Smittium culicis]|uniref:Uncharacterized protein n=1 Tax=Smittium culicis TaxID=133412 RepID=A0A1R1XC26_9FUNG|nr:hypothetical protein AYI69_g9520 [Smittium culicis]